MMTTGTATSNAATDSASRYPGHATTPPSLGRSDTPPRNFNDAVALTWDLTVHQLHQAFSRCMAAPSTGLPDVGASQELARTRLAAARHAVDDIQAALNRMACGTYGRCQRCGRMIAADRLQASPTARWCAPCQV
ncbi:TraR/DksA family transcriptional regulator [Actinoplanes sp. NPDC048791]|uniref:TraR/DksA family transcriptional regulator n=1 Tax=Actinoplanes sp. NPDC048791 TaxID=3154623 RepID=UPI0033FA2B0F